MWPRAASLLVALGWAGSLRAQEVTGTLSREVDGRAPAVGVLVVAERLGSNAVLSRTVSGPGGVFRLRLPTERVVVRALRVGKVPVLLDTVQLGALESRDLSRVLPEAPVAIAATRLVASARCRVTPTAARRVAFWFTEARTALIASKVDPPEGTVRSRVRIVTTEGSVTTRSDEGVIASLRAFQSAPFDTIVRTGFLVTERDGATRYRAPDADLLVDARFLERYCLHDVTTPDSLAGLVGIGFRPVVRRRNLVDVQGTLWIDSATSMLRRLAFAYVGADPLIEQAGAGGHLDYERLGNGVWFVQRWTLRTPRVGEATVVRRRDMRGGLLREVTGVPVVAGEVLDVRAATALLFTTGNPLASDVVGGPAETQALDALRARTCGASSRGALVGQIVGAVSDAEGSVVALAGVDVHVLDDETVVTRVQTDAAGRFVVCGIARSVTLGIAAAADGYRPSRVQLRVPADQESARTDLVLRQP